MSTRIPAAVWSLAVLAGALAAGCGAEPEDIVSPEPAWVESGAFADGEPIPIEHTCDGRDVPVPLAWEGVHPGAKELMVVVDDDDAWVDGHRFVHWMVAGLPPGDGAIDDGPLPAGAVEGRTDFGETGWGGPCPPADDGAHTYRFRVVALDQPSGLRAGFTIDDLERVARDHALSEAVLTGHYEREHAGGG